MAVISLVSSVLDIVSSAIRPRRALAEVTEVELIISDLGEAFDGFTIVALADFHHRHPLDDLRWLRHAVDAVNHIAPDLIVLLGDYASSFKRARALSTKWYQEALPRMTGELQRLRARDGMVAVLGNHDYYVDVDLVKDWVHAIGATLLVNGAHCIVRSDQAVRVAGLDDSQEGKVDPLVGSALVDQPPTVALSHEPDGIWRLDPRLRIDVMLAGHTHGGQIVIPGYGAPLTMSPICGRRNAHGWVPNSRAPLYITRGLGEQLPLPIRIGCPPEILVLRLRRSRQQPA